MRQGWNAVRKSVLKLYGNVALESAFCSDCRSWSFVFKGKLACCDRPIVAEPHRIKREVEPEFRRRLPSAAEREEILNQQNHQCIYCECTFGMQFLRNGRKRILRVEWDHALPFSYSQNNNANNFVAACQVCNRLKHDFIFSSLDEARVYLADQRAKKGYSF